MQMKKLLAVSALSAAILAGGSFALASTTTSETSGFTFSFNSESFTQSDWGTVSGEGYTVLAECPTGQKFVNIYLESEDNYGGYTIPDVSSYPTYLHKNSNGDSDGLYLHSGVGQGGQGNGAVELICAS